MLVKEMVEAIANKDLKVDELAKKYGCTTRTIQYKIKGLGFQWDSKEARYNYVGNDKERVYNLDINEVFHIEKPTKNVSKTTDVNKGETTIKSNSNTTVKNNIKEDVKKISNKAVDKTIDNIDRLLLGKKSKKEYRGFYLDSDVIGIIDSVDNGIKSELVNECLRKVFKEKGLL